MHPLLRTLVALGLGAGSALAQDPEPAARRAPDPAALRIYPAAIRLDDARDRQRVAVLAVHADGTGRDVTADCALALRDDGVATLGAEHTLAPVRDGETALVARLRGLEAEAPVVVARAHDAPAISFANEVVPILTRSGCNAGSCHGSAAGKNGFRLSLFGFDKAADHAALTRELRGRRINPAAPEDSLMLCKPTTAVSHKGGKRLDPDSESYRLLRDWIGAGAPSDLAVAPRLSGIEMTPAQMLLDGAGAAQRIVVTARYADGTDRDVTDLALLSSSNERGAALASGGVVRAGEPGESIVMARFGTFAVVSQVLVRRAGARFTWPEDVRASNYLDVAIHDKLAARQVAPGAVCDDATFVRRVYLDILNVLPTVDETRRFLDEVRDDKRTRLVDELLARPEFPDVWAMQWAEVLGIEPTRLYAKGTHAYTRYLRESFRAGKPFDQLTRELLTGTGAGFSNPAANFYIVSRDAKKTAENVAQLFLGVRVQCAQCHNHPFERWTMGDYYGFAAFFTQVTSKRAEDPRERVVYNRGRGEIRNPVTKKNAVPKFLGGAEPEIPRGKDRREVVADWITSRDNPRFAQNIANRIFARFFGRGLVDPPDDVRVSNPPSHPALHQELGARLVEYDFDFARLIRDICGSRTYQLATDPDAPPAALFAGAPIRRLSAEQLLDAIGQVTGVPPRYTGLATGARATEVAGRGASRFFEVFGRPNRSSACTCDRRDEPTLSQALHLINGETTETRLRAKGSRLTRLLAAGAPDEDVLDELYLAAYARLPSAEEQCTTLQHITAADREPVWEDIFWAVLNSKEFLFNH